jgi:hypothetical protein
MCSFFVSLFLQARKDLEDLNKKLEVIAKYHVTFFNGHSVNLRTYEVADTKSKSHGHAFVSPAMK